MSFVIQIKPSQVALLKSVFSCCFSALLVTVALSAAADPPNPAAQQQMLDKLRQYAGRYLDNLPNFVCSRVTEQYDAGKKPGNWRQRDTLTAKLIFNQGKENQTLELVNGKPIRAGHYINQPLATEVEFGGLVSNVLDERADAEISWSRWEDLRGHKLAVFAYTVDRQHSRVTLGVGGIAATVPFRGLIFADAGTGELWRITSEAFDIPDAADAKSITTTVDYGSVDINNKRFNLPVAASVWLNTGNRNILNKVSFNNYRKFDAESKITFVTGSN